MTDRKTVRPGEAVEAARAAQRTLNDALETAKQLKVKSRDAKRRVKAAKKAAKKAGKDARAAKEAAEKARRQYKKAVARAAKVRAKAAKAKKEEKIVTPKRRARSSSHPSARRVERARVRARRRVWEVGEEAADTGGAVSESVTPSLTGA